MSSADQKDSADRGRRDPVTRQAAIVATLVALPVTVLVAIFAINQFSPEPTDPETEPTASAPGPQPTAAVSMAAPALDERSEVICRALLAQLPERVRDREQRPVTAGHEQNAAYGEPPITLACGIPMPELPPTDLVYPLDKVCWHADERSDATVWTTVDREVPVQVTVPRSYDEPGQWVIPFSGPVGAAVPAAEEIPTGCGG